MNDLVSDAGFTTEKIYTAAISCITEVKKLFDLVSRVSSKNTSKVSSDWQNSGFDGLLSALM